MSLLKKILLLALLVVFTFACNFFNPSVEPMQGLVKTAVAIDTANAMETPLEALTTPGIPYEDMFDPQGEPVVEWNGIPIMEQATAGKELDANTYSFQFTGKTKDAVVFYNDQMIKLGWSSVFTVPGLGGVERSLTFQKDDVTLYISVNSKDETSVIVVLHRQ